VASLSAGHTPRQYRPGGEFIANREFVFGERLIAVGERIPWRELGLHEWRMFEFWRANMIDSAPVGVAAVARAVEPPKPPKRK
jgi:hypothetical protein